MRFLDAAPGSLADRSGLLAGNPVLAVDRHAIGSLTDYLAHVSPLPPYRR